MDAIFEHVSAREHEEDIVAWLEARLGSRHALNRLKRESQNEATMRHSSLRRWLSLSTIIDTLAPIALRTSGLLSPGRRNASRIEVVRNQVDLPRLPETFDGFSILHLSDLHADISEGAMQALPEAVGGLEYDICVITGDFRGKTYGPHGRAVELVRKMMAAIGNPTFGILGNHDTAAMLPALEWSGVRMLMNEAEAICRGSDRLWLAGVDDPHFYRMDDLSTALEGVPRDDAVVLLSHSADGHERAAHSGVDLLLCGHTHGGQICLPGGIPVLTSSRLPRRLASGPWRQGDMVGYTSRGVGTSAIDARFNCSPEVTLHTLRNH